MGEQRTIDDRVGHVHSIKTLTTDVGMVYACERCSRHWFRTYEEAAAMPESEAMTPPPLTAMQKLENIMKGIKVNAKEGVDAERYNWLREHWDEMTGLTWRAPIADKLDAHIDAAIEAAEKTP